MMHIETTSAVKRYKYKVCRRFPLTMWSAAIHGAVYNDRFNRERRSAYSRYVKMYPVGGPSSFYQCIVSQIMHVETDLLSASRVRKPYSILGL